MAQAHLHRHARRVWSASRPSSTSALDALPTERLRRRPARGPRSRERRHGAALGRRRRRRRRGVHRRRRSTSTTRRRSGRRRARSSTCRWSAASTPRGRSSTLSARGHPRPRDGRPTAPSDLYGADLTGPIAFVFGNEAHGLPPEVVALGRRHRARAARGAGGIAEPRRRRHRLPVRVAAPPADARARRSRRIIAAAAHDIRSPLTAMKGFGYALEKRWDSMTDEQRARDAAGDRARCRPDGHDRAPAGRCGAGRRRATSSSSREQVDVADARGGRSPTRSAAIPTIRRSSGRASR